MKKITGDDLLRAAAYAVAHPEEYDQSTWCGTACCVLGHARRMCDSDPARGGPQDGEIVAITPRDRMLAGMLLWRHADTAALMPHVGEDGVLRVPEGGVGSFGAGARICDGAVICDGVVIGSGVRIGDGARICAGARICDGAVICDGVVIGSGVRIGDGVEIGCRAQIGAGVRIDAGARICDGAVICGGARAVVDADKK